MRRWLPLLCVPLLLALILSAAEPPRGGYVVVLKNGHRIRAREPLRIEGRSAMITLVTGTLSSLPLEQVDLIATERYNQLGLGDALIIDELTGETPVPTSTPRMSLGNYTQLDLEANPYLGVATTPTATPTPGIRLQTVPYGNQRIERALTQAFEDRHFYLYRTSAGTQERFFYIQAVTDSQKQVFEALKIITESYVLIHRLDPAEAPVAVEIELLSSQGKAAGTFRLDVETAKVLANGEVSVEQFYVDHVIF